MRLFATATLRQLLRRRGLAAIGAPLGFDSGGMATFLRRLLSAPEGLDAGGCPEPLVAFLKEKCLAVAANHSLPRPGLPFAFVEAINFELTYGCNLACSHCLQAALRPGGRIPWIDASAVTQTLEDAAWLGLVRGGINLTGGEAYLPGSPVLELIDNAARAGIRVRSNTNAWWGGRSRFTVGDECFDSDATFVSHLRSIGLTRLVVSLDRRYEQYPDLLDRVVRVAALCEAVGQTYEVVATDAPEPLVTKALHELAQLIGGQPRFLWLTPMDTVDIGAAAGSADNSLQTDRLAALTTQSPCARKGFFRPYYLHVNPGGGVRSCLYAPGIAPLGNIKRERLPEILNRADGNPVLQLYASGRLDDFVNALIEPWGHLYRDVTHACGASALIARVAIAVAGERERLGRDITTEELTSVHRTIATEWNLLATGAGG